MRTALETPINRFENVVRKDSNSFEQIKNADQREKKRLVVDYPWKIDT